MSLFANIFKSKGKATTNSLFSEKSKFKARDDGEIPASAPKVAKTAAAKRKAGSGSSAKEASAPSKATKKPKTTKEDAVVKKGKTGKTPKDKEATRKQAEKAKDLATAARRLEASNSEEESEDDSDVDIASSDEEEEEEQKVATAKPGGKKASGKAKEPSSSSDDDEAGAEDDVAEEEKKDQINKNINDPKVLVRTIFVGNIPASAKKKALTALFQTYGTIESVRLRSVPLKKDVILPRKAAVASGAVDPTRGSAHAYIIYNDAESAQKAVKKQNMKEWLGQHLRVDAAARASVKSTTGSDKAEKSADVKYDPTRSVFIGNLPLETKDEELIRFFINGVGAGGEDELEAVRIVRDPHTSIGKGIAYALFKTPAGRRAALGLNGRKLRERPLRITSIKTTGGGGGRTFSNSTSTGAPGERGGERGGKFKSERGTAPWQGVTATQSGRSRGPVGGISKSGGTGGGTGGKGGKSITRKGGKRAAVMARKQKQLGQPVTAGVKNRHRPSMGGSGPARN
jgi:nucleolar protein 12